MQKNDLKKCKKLTIIILIFLLCAQLPLCAHSGMFFGEKKLRVTKTKWFDIIYPERCEESARILYEKADLVYEEVTAQYDLVPAFRMPVIITPAVEQFNGMWTSVPYNHICIYDTGFSGSMEMAVFSQTLLSTLRHELTHAVTYNMKNGFWRFMGNIFGDCAAPGMIAVTTGMAEGATVTSESASGEGRLNDEYAKHYVKQAKIENKFPSYHDVSGASDVSPGGAPYYFNGAFHQWLQDNYGMQAYAEFWYRIVNAKSITVSGAFKKSFGIKLKKAWKLFEEEYEVPALAANPVKSGEAADFFEPSKNQYSNLNSAGSFYSSLSEGNGRLVWMDKYGWRIFSAQMPEKSQAENSKSSKPRVRHIFDQRNVSSVQLSPDGRFLAVTFYDDNFGAQKSCVKLYDFNTGAFYSVKETGLKEAVIVQSEEKLYLVAQKYSAQHYSISISKILLSENSGRISEVLPATEIIMESEVNPFEFTSVNSTEGSFAYIKKDKLAYSLCICDTEGSVLKEIAFPQGMAVRSLSYSSAEETFYFSYAQKNTMPRLGMLKISTGELLLSDSDISGGLFEPVYWNGKIVYIGKFLRENRILILQEKNLAAALPQYQKSSEEEAEEKSDKIAFAIHEETVIPSKAYNPLPYHLKGIFIPMSIYESSYSGSASVAPSDYVNNLRNLYLGATYITGNPWTDGYSDLITLTGGWNIASETFGTSLTVNKGTSSSLLRGKAEIKSEFDVKGWKQSGGNLTLSSVLRAGKVSSITVTNSATMNFSRDENKFSDVISLQYSTIRRGGPGRFENRGFLISGSYGKWVSTYESQSVSATAKLCIPHLLPFESKTGFTYNLPLTARFKLLPSSTSYGYVYTGEKLKTLNPGRAIFDITIEAPVFGMDVQKAIPGITALYLNDFYFICGYEASGTAGSATKNGFQAVYLDNYFRALGNGTGYYLDSAYIKTGLEFTPNIGLFASSSYKMNVYAICSYSLHGIKQLKPAERVNFLFGLDMNF